MSFSKTVIFEFEKLGDKLSYSAHRTVFLASVQSDYEPDNGQQVALKMMQKQTIIESGDFHYLQMEKEVNK